MPLCISLRSFAGVLLLADEPTEAVVPPDAATDGEPSGEVCEVVPVAVETWPCLLERLGIEEQFAYGIRKVRVLP